MESSEVGRTGQWLKFLGRMSGRGYEAVDSLSLRKESETVQMRCQAHPKAHVKPWTRAKFGQWLATFSLTNMKHFPPPCEACAAEYAVENGVRKGMTREENLKRIEDRLAVFNYRLVTRRPMTVKDPVTKKPVSQTNDIECLACHHIRPVFVAQTLRRAEARKHMGCPQCNPTPMGPQQRSVKPV